MRYDGVRKEKAGDSLPGVGPIEKRGRPQG